MRTPAYLAVAGLLLSCACPLFSETNPNCPTDPALAGSITNVAAGLSGYYSGYSFVQITGLNMPVVSSSIGPSSGGTNLPITLHGVTVLVNGIWGYIFSYTPNQVFVLLPRISGCVSLYIEANGLAQFQAQIFLSNTAPALFTNADGQSVIASHGDWSLVTDTSPAHAGEKISLWAAGSDP